MSPVEPPYTKPRDSEQTTTIRSGAITPNNIIEPGNSGEESRGIKGKTDHGEQRSQQAREGDSSRQVGDVNRVIQEGRLLEDTETGYYVYVKGDRVVIVDPATNQQITQFKNSRANTQKRIESGRWNPIP